MITEEQATQEKSLQEGFNAVLQSHFSKIDQTDPLQKLRLKSWDRFCELGLPAKTHDVYRYLPLKNLYGQGYVKASLSDVSLDKILPHVLPECRKSFLVFVNGHYVKDLSCVEAISNKVVITSLNEAASTYGTFLSNQWNKGLKEETDPFSLLNGALHERGLFIYIPPKTLVEAPIQLLSIIDAKSEAMLILPRLQAFIGSGSEISLVSTSALISGEQYGAFAFCDLAIEENSRVLYTQTARNLSSKVWHFEALRAQLKRNAGLKTCAIVANREAVVRYDYKVALTGENAEANLNGLNLLHDKAEAHTHVLIEHQAPNCRSFQLYKGALDGYSHSAFEGKILVRQAAQKTEAFQLNNHLLLSDYAHADSKPNLEIFADDVKASHGATVGQLDQEMVFYLKTRGFSAAEAKTLLVDSFCQQVLDLVPIASLKSI
jgi:Fe-S cluster assembly protein SufD